MLDRIETALRRWRRRFSRSEWMARLLKLPHSDSEPSDHGLVLIQVDGLAYPQLEKALAKNEMPFLRKLIRKEHYHLEHMYPGVPSTTPAVQAELLYGLRQVVPAFAFMMRDTQELVRMYHPEAVTRVQEKIDACAPEPLLEGGSCYLSIFNAGTREGEAHFCPASSGWGPVLRAARPVTILMLVLGNFWSLVRGAALVAVETMLALVDCVRGVSRGQNLLQELKFIPTRVAVTILMRELCTAGVKIDIARGLPAIYVNLLGYDEQSHRRGPSSAFAHWTLKGIDDAIARIWRAAHRSGRRHYDVWIFSDHGQEHSEPYEKRYGRDFGEAINDALSELHATPEGYRSSGRRGVQLERARLVGGEWIQKMVPEDRPLHSNQDSPVALAALGPMAMLYNLPLEGTTADRVAQLIVEKAKVPLVLYLGEPDDPQKPHHKPVLGWSLHGPVRLPKDGPRLLGKDHLFAEQAAKDLARLCSHPDAGEFVMSGWIAGLEPMTFAEENGSHGGIGPNECHAFALMPADTPPPDPRRGYWRPRDMYKAAREYLKIDEKARHAATATEMPAGEAHKLAWTSRETREPGVLRVMTYNVHSCRGMDGKLAPRRIARVIARYAPDVVALQELDVRRERTGGIDQAAKIARLLAMEYHFHPAIHLEEERYGDAILSHLPMHLVKTDILPGPPPGTTNPFNPAANEPRGALWVEIEFEGRKVQILTTHLGLGKAERLRQVDALLGHGWLGNPRCKGPRILMGDFNALPNSAECKRLSGHLHDAQLHMEGHRPRGTFYSRMPKARIDYIFMERHMAVKRILVPSSELTRTASDHLPLIADLKIEDW